MNFHESKHLINEDFIFKTIYEYLMEILAKLEQIMLLFF